MNSSLQKLRECFNESFFSTQISSRSNFYHDQSPNAKHLIKISSKFTQDPEIYLKKMKKKKKQASFKYLQAVRNTVKAKMNLQKTEKDASVSRYDFIKLYHTKKFKLLEQSLLSNHNNQEQFSNKRSLEKIKKMRALDHLSISSRKQQTERKMQDLFQINRNNKDIFRQTLRFSQEKSQQKIEESAQKIRKQKNNFIIRKRNLNDLLTTKSKFNYLCKINEEMQIIKDYQQMINLIDQETENEQKDNRKFANTFTSKFS